MLTLNEKYRPLFDNKTRYNILTGGRGSAKSFSLSTFLLLLSFENNQRILFTRLTMISAHLSIIPEFIQKIEMFDMGDKFSITNTEITNLYSGSTILFKGIKTSSGDNTANLKSLTGITVWVVDEAEELQDENIFDKINLSVREKTQFNRVILSMNPTTKENFIYKRFFEEAGVQPGSNTIKDNTTYIHTTYLDNIGNLDQSFIDEVESLKIKNPDKYKHVVLGGWLDKAEGVIYTNWSISPFQEISPPVFGQDFGFSIDPTTLVKTSIDHARKKIYLREYLYQQRMTTTDIYVANMRYANGTLIYADGAEPRLISEIGAKGCNIISCPKPPGSILAGIAILQDFELVIDPESINLIKELNNYVWHDKKSKIPIDAYNHLLDAVRYAIYPQLAAKKERTFFAG